MCTYKDRNEFYTHTLILIILMSICGGFGVYLIYDSQVQRHEVPCKLISIISVECNYHSINDWYHTVTFILLSVNNTNYTTMMIDDCNSCLICKDLYKVNHVYKCALVNDMYKIFDSRHTTKYGSLVFGIILLILGSGLAVTIIVIFIKSRSYVNTV